MLGVNKAGCKSLKISSKEELNHLPLTGDRLEIPEQADVSLSSIIDETDEIALEVMEEFVEEQDDRRSTMNSFTPRNPTTENINQHRMEIGQFNTPQHVLKNRARPRRAGKSGQPNRVRSEPKPTGYRGRQDYRTDLRAVQTDLTDILNLASSANTLIG